MRNLENYGVQELNKKILPNINGGNIRSWVAGALVTFAYNCFADWDENVEAFKRGMESAR